MRAVHRAALLFVILLTATFSFAQQDPVALTDFPVPAWPANGVVPADMKDKYVFVDLAKNQYVVAYPENLGSATFEKDGPGPLKTGRFELLRNVAPVVSVAVTASGGKFKYAYNVANTPSGKQSLDQWSLVLPEKANPVLKGPDGWFAIHQAGRKFKVKDPNWIKTGGAAVWSFRKPEQVINPGDAKGGFELESELRPGFTLGYFRKAESVEATVAASGAGYPNPVRDQVNELLAVEYNSKTLVTIGPKFDSTADDKTIAADFVQGINALAVSGQLDANSDFVKSLVDQLKAVQGGTPASGVKIPAAKSPAETSVISALKVSLKVS